MKKTLLRISLLGFASAALLLTSCEQPTAFDQSLSYAKIGSVENVKVTGYTGANLLTWDPVVDADSYTVYRREKPKDQDWGAYQQLGNGNANSILYVDVISDSNVLQNETEYTYKVVANAAGRLDTVGSSSAEVTYKTEAAQFPDRGTDLKIAIKDAKIAVDNVYGRATLTWTGSDNPAIQYSVTQSNNSPSWLSPTGTSVVTTNITGDGMIDARIYATFAGSTYYPASAAVYVEPVAYNVQHLDSISANLNLSAVRSGYTNQVTVSYPLVNGATAYILEKAKTNSVGSVLTWEVVSTANALLVQGNTYQVTDTVDKDAWQYRLFVRTANGISTAATSYVSAVPADVVNGWASLSSQQTSSGSGIYQFSFSFNGFALGETYQLLYRKVGSSNGTYSGAADVGTWEKGASVSVAGTAVSPSIASITFTPETQAQKYQFRILGTAANKQGRIQDIGYSSGPNLFPSNEIVDGESVYIFAVQ